MEETPDPSEISLSPEFVWDSQRDVTTESVESVLHFGEGGDQVCLVNLREERLERQSDSYCNRLNRRNKLEITLERQRPDFPVVEAPSEENFRRQLASSLENLQSAASSPTSRQPSMTDRSRSASQTSTGSIDPS